MVFTLRDVFSFSVITLLLTLIIYHFFILFGRKGKERNYYVFFSLFALNFLIYLLCVTDVQRLIFPSEEIRRMISPAITGISYFLMLHFALKIFCVIFNYSNSKVLAPFYISFFLYGILVATYPFLAYDYYMSNIFPYEAIFATISPLYMFSVFSFNFIKSKERRKDIPSQITLFMFFVFMLDFFMEEMFSVMEIPYIFKGTYFVSGVSVLIWAFALAIKFNNEHKELQALKVSLEDKIKERTLQLEAANEQRINTFVQLAHETRTPLTLIKNNLDELSELHKISFDKVNTHIEKINKLIDNIIKIEKFEKGFEIYNHDKLINVSEFIKEKVDYFKSYIAKKKLEIKTQIQLGVYLKVSPDALESLLDNLITNAIKFTLKGIISVSLSSDKSKTVISVKDTGVGMPIDIQNKIFEPYFHSSKDNKGGFGIGLTIVKNIVDSLSGDIKFTTTLDIGTDFIITFPSYIPKNTDKIFKDHIMKSPTIETANFEVEDITTNDTKPHILIIEDNKELLSYLLEKLKNDFNIYAALNGTIALHKIIEQKIKPDLIISDVMMESMDGLEFYEKLKKSDYNYIPIIYITAKSTPIDKNKALELGAIDYIYKPFEINEVRKKITSIIENSKKQRNFAIRNVKKILDSNLHETIKVKEMDSFESNCNLYEISKREKEIIEKALEGKSYDEIAELLNISKKTVNNHFQSIFKKVGVNRLPELLIKIKK